MTEKPSGGEENAMLGLSVVDSLNVPADNVAQQAEDDSDMFITEEEVRCLIKVEDDVDDAPDNGEVSAAKGASCEDNLFVVDESRRENRVGEAECEIIFKEVHEDVAASDTEDNKEVKEVENSRKRSTQNSGLSSTLIITTEEHLDSTTFDDALNNSEDKLVKPIKSPTKLESKTNNSSDELCKKSSKLRSKKDDHNYFWVSNISRHVKATDLKKFFAQLGKVLTAKILTNGKSYFGYVSMDSGELAAKCIKQLNNTLFDNRKIVVSKDRPDLRETKGPMKIEPRKKRIEKFDAKKSEKSIEQKIPAVLKVEPKEKKITEDETIKSNNAIAELRRKLERSKSEATRLNWKLVEFQRRHDGMRKKCDTLERELKEMQYKMRNERRRLNQDREQFEKNKKLEQIRFEADRAIINKELDEVKKLREHLKEKIEEFKAQTKKAAVKRRSRSPVIRVRSPRGRSPLLRNNNPNAGFRLDERTEKKRKRDDVSHGRTPPPPPKLSSVVGKKRSDRGSENSAPNRPYFGEVDKRPSCHEYDYRHKSSYVQPQDPARGPWQTPYPKDPRRLNPGPSTSQNYPVDMRYGGSYQYPPSNIPGPPRNYYPEFGKPYGHF